MDEQKKQMEEVIKNKFPDFIEMLEQNLDFKFHGFTRKFSGLGKFTPILIYESEVCRVKFSWQIPDIRDFNETISISYGRSHAPNDEEIITWRGQKCYCWHDVKKVLFFLDGLSANQATGDKFLWPKIIEQFRTSSINKNWKQPEYMAKMHEAIWKHYGQRLFEVFDLHKPSLWEQYSQFISEYQKLQAEFSSSGAPTRDKIC